MTERNPALTIAVKTHAHYTECEPWCQATVGEWNQNWWRDFPDMAMNIALGQVTQPETYWFQNEQHALMFALRFV
jgi:hypothetical protein